MRNGTMTAHQQHAARQFLLAAADALGWCAALICAYILGMAIASVV